jgi:tetratricopeptide (TPR) repeat protein
LRLFILIKPQESTYASEDFKVVRELDPSNEHAIFNLAIYSFHKQLWDDAIQAFSKLMSLNPDNGQGYIFRGRAYAALSRWDEALEVSGE